MISRRSLFTIIGFLLLEVALIGWVDRPVSEMLRSVDQGHHAIIDFFRAWTDYGKSKWSLWPSGIGIVLCAGILRQKSLAQKTRETIRKTGNFLLFLFVCVAVSGIITDILKPVLGRARPVELEQARFYGFHPLSFAARWNSMPSGHATSAFALAFTIAGFFPRLRIPLFVIATALACSRIMVNAHFVSDVVAGGTIAFLTYTSLKRKKYRDGIFHISNVIFPIDNASLEP